MFNHGYSNYMTHAYPADELMPLSCTGRYRGSHPSRGDMDDSLGNFSLTLVDTLDTLVVLGLLDEFAVAVNLTIKNVHFDRDVVVSVFETNIRMIGGLLSAHIFAAELAVKRKMQWYRGELLDLARDLGDRLLPAFNTSTGIPYPKVNLMYGVTGDKARTGHEQDTCTACAGTMILEFATLSRLTGNGIYEEKAHKAMEFLWKSRHRGSDLVGTIINIHNGDWIRKESGVGAGIDSYYEYMLKAYILLGDKTYLSRFNTHYSAVSKYIDKGYSMTNVEMNRPNTVSRHFMDALLAFWPGLQVLKGDLKAAVRIHEMLYQVIQEHIFLPEVISPISYFYVYILHRKQAFTKDFRIHWGFYRLRPEFIESTYFLYKATGDDHYLEVAKESLENLEKYTRVKCGFASIGDIKKLSHDDQMDSYLLAEAFKYLYLLFAEESELPINIDKYLFTTEAHLLPLSISTHNSSFTLNDFTTINEEDDDDDDFDSTMEHATTCPNHNIDSSISFVYTIRSGMKNLIRSENDDAFTFNSAKSATRLKGSEFQNGNKEHIKALRRMGISLQTQADGRVQMLLNTVNAESPTLAEYGNLFMKEMVELSKFRSDDVVSNLVLQVIKPHQLATIQLHAGSAQFGKNLHKQAIEAELISAHPSLACDVDSVKNRRIFEDKIVIVKRGDCMFIEKARILEKWGAFGDNVPGTAAATAPLFSMSGDGKGNVKIPLIFLFSSEAEQLLKVLKDNSNIMVRISTQAIKPEEIIKSQEYENMKNTLRPKIPPVSNKIADDYVTIVNEEFEVKINKRSVSCRWLDAYGKGKITAKMSYKNPGEFAINVYMDKTLQRSVQRFSMASKMIRLLNTVVKHDKDRNLNLLASSMEDEQMDEFRAFIKMCQAIFSNIDVSGDSSWRNLIGIEPINNRELHRVEIYCQGEDARLLDEQKEIARQIYDLYAANLRILTRSDDSYTNPYYWYRLKEFKGQLMCDLFESPMRIDNTVFERMFTQLSQSVPEN